MSTCRSSKDVVCALVCLPEVLPSLGTVLELFVMRRLESIFFGGMRGEVWIEPGKQPTQARTAMTAEAVVLAKCVSESFYKCCKVVAPSNSTGSHCLSSYQ